MRAVLPALAGLLLLALEAAGTLDLARESRCALTLLPLAALLGWPRPRHDRPGPLPKDSLPASLLAGVAATLPVLGLSAALDLRACVPATVVAWAGGVGLPMALAWGASARLSRAASPFVHRLHTLAWLLLVPGAAALEVALRWAPLAGPLRGGDPWRFSPSPLSWLARVGSTEPGSFAPVVLATVAVLAGTLALGPGERRGGSLP